MIISVGQEHTRSVLIVDSQFFNQHTLLIRPQDISQFPSHWLFWGHIYKLKWFGLELAYVDSRRIKIAPPLAIEDWAEDENWLIGIRPNHWLWRDKRLWEQSDLLSLEIIAYQ